MQKQKQHLLRKSHIYTYSTSAVILIANETANINGCTHSRAKTAIVIDFDTTGKEMYSAALAAFMSDSKIRIAHNNCKNGVALLYLLHIE